MIKLNANVNDVNIPVEFSDHEIITGLRNAESEVVSEYFIQNLIEDNIIYEIAANEFSDDDVRNRIIDSEPYQEMVIYYTSDYAQHAVEEIVNNTFYSNVVNKLREIEEETREFFYEIEVEVVRTYRNCIKIKANEKLESADIESFIYNNDFGIIEDIISNSYDGDDELNIVDWSQESEQFSDDYYYDFEL